MGLIQKLRDIAAIEARCEELEKLLEDMRGEYKAVSRTLEDVSDRAEHAHRRINRLQGQITGGVRTTSLANGEEQDPDGEPDAAQDINERIRQGLPIGGIS